MCRVLPVSVPSKDFRFLAGELIRFGFDAIADRRPIRAEEIDWATVTLSDRSKSVLQILLKAHIVTRTITSDDGDCYAVSFESIFAAFKQFIMEGQSAFLAANVPRELAHS